MLFKERPKGFETYSIHFHPLGHINSKSAQRALKRPPIGVAPQINTRFKERPKGFETFFSNGRFFKLDNSKSAQRALKQL